MRKPTGRANPVRLNQPHPLQARVRVLADDDVVVHGNAERARDADDRLRHLDIGLRGRGIAGRMVVHQIIARATRLMLFDFHTGSYAGGRRLGAVRGVC